MFGPTKPSICGPFGEGHIALQAYYQDGTSRERRGSDNSAMRSITTEAVIEACDQMIERLMVNQRRSA